MNLRQLVNEYKNQALSIDFKKDMPAKASSIFLSLKQLTENAEFESEKSEAKEICENRIKEVKKRLLMAIQNESYKHTYTNVTPPFILDLRLYLDYKELYNLITEPQAQSEIDKEALPPSKSFAFLNNFDKVEPNKVYKHFFKLVEKGYLSNEDLEKYLLLAFQNKTLPKEKFSFSNLHIEKVRTIFYTYFCEIANKPHGKKTEYAELLGNYFNSFTTKKVDNNFADGYKKVRK